MGKNTGFLEWNRKGADKRTAPGRLDDFKEVYLERPEAVSSQQGGRCMDCGVPFCQQGCPLGNLIPDWNHLVYKQDWQRASKRLHATNNFPEFTGRLCPAPCEAACVLTVNDDAVTIEQIEREIVERAFAEGWISAKPPKTRTGKRVAVVGSGPAGLAAAAQLNRVGHSITVYEKADRIGGLLRYGIPDFKMEKWVVDRRLAVMEEEGVQFKTNVAVGDDVSWAMLSDQYDAVLIAIGAESARNLHVPGREANGVHLAMDFLTRNNKRVAGDTVDIIDAKGRRVVILGGGDTGSDCLGTALRMGAADVLQLEIMPAPPSRRDQMNPWPQWPLIMRTSTSHEEGGRRDWALMTKKLVADESGRVAQLHAVHVVFEQQTNGSRPQLVEVEGSEVVIETDLILLAMGFLSPVTENLVAQLGVALTARGGVAVDEHFKTNVDGVYCAGDAHRGASLIVWAISEGREAARSIDQNLRDSDQSWLPTRGVHQHFGGR